MARNAWPTVFTGDSWSAAQHNTYGRDNDAAYWVYTNPGDLAIASAANTLKRLGLGSPLQSLRVNPAGNDLEYGAPRLPFCVVRHNTTQTIATSETTLLWNTDDFDDYGWHNTVTGSQWITPNVSGWFVASLFYSVSGVGGSGQALWTARLYAPSSMIYQDRQLLNSDANTKYRLLTTPPIFLNGSSDAVGWTLQHGDGASRTFNADSRFGLVRIG